MREREKDIVTVGGGTGSPIVNRALLLAGVPHINAIAAMYDNGGYTGKRRLLDETGKEVAYSDALRIMCSLIDPNNRNQRQKAEVITEWFTFKNGNGEVPGYGLAHNWFDSQKGLEKLQRDVNKLGIRLMGQVLPSSTESAHIKFTTMLGNTYSGEALLDEQEKSTDMVISMVLEPTVSAFLPARKAIEEAQVIFLSCGSLHGSVLCNFLPDGMKDSIAKSKAKVYVITNLVSNRNETHEFSPRDYIRVVEEYIGNGRIDGIIVPDISRFEFESRDPQTTILYAQEESSHFLGWEQEELHKVQKEGIQIITHRATDVVVVPASKSEKEKRIIRHNPEKLKDALEDLIK
ncbi:hypothetical protein A2803_00295 [Candidatus Woesebacteria bacterium RIFCSPHIGHO2_01_FULL_44_21]|uniref:Gluconeogenesis factor n=1 Tax=Candidatus Woesebacteria bacterium RIFCSPHIGHO2_01_FULL_44_21 TaxID=1802503 RepID=A0A1F7YXY0_9BACT|nr:MAG: hypothetical protein A2803_00295 [Candidatus Woesebacteria bacterium RIFCSPHIGHO2_01_FULL_44_21]OGM68910.1 MAG: hypothetical protein A2897_01990 [Candidatus Woesebacteria bacterium RIFCSPLOWO2_01_FULL_44_24b]